MICKNCQSENVSHAEFCIKCGYKLEKDVPEIQGKNLYADTVIIIISIFMAINGLFWFGFRFYWLAYKSRYDYFSTFRYLEIFSNLMYAAIPLLLAFIVKNKVWRIILIVTGCIYAVIHLISIFNNFNNYF
ncbi:MAG TPA: zinc ribbon domain-containing protein [Bacteroidales bacterium]|nr:zinc ribbon domain-containing protein [Bacteroidales bacterium]